MLIKICMGMLSVLKNYEIIGNIMLTVSSLKILLGFECTLILYA